MKRQYFALLVARSSSASVCISREALADAKQQALKKTAHDNVRCKEGFGVNASLSLRPSIGEKLADAWFQPQCQEVWRQQWLKLRLWCFRVKGNSDALEVWLYAL